jgi:hypothetical protein
MNDLESRLRAALHDETAELAARPDLADDMVTRGTTVRRRRRVVGGAAGLVVLAALVPVWKTIDTSSGPPPIAHTPTPTVITQAPPPTTPTQTTQTPPAWSTKAVDAPLTTTQVPIVTDMRVGRHDGYDRVVLDLSGPMCGYHIAYVPRLFQQASGDQVDLPGNAFLAISLFGASTHTPNGATAYFQAPDKHTYPFTTLQGTAFLGEFEGTTAFGLGLSHKAGFHVDELSSPTRLVIDLQH